MKKQCKAIVTQPWDGLHRRCMNNVKKTQEYCWIHRKKAMEKKTYKHMLFRKHKEKWGETVWQCFDRKCAMLRGVIKLYGDKAIGQRWMFNPCMAMLFPSDNLYDIADYIIQLNKQLAATHD